MNFQIDDVWHSVMVTIADTLCFIPSDIDFCDSHNVYFVPISYQAFKYGWVLITLKTGSFEKFVKEAGGDADMKPLSWHSCDCTDWGTQKGSANESGGIIRPLTAWHSEVCQNVL